MARRLSEKQKKEIIKFFTSGKTVVELSKDFECTKLTISRNLKKALGETKYKEFIQKNKSSKQFNPLKEKSLSTEKTNNLDQKIHNDTFTKNNIEKNYEEQDFFVTPFIEITPLNCEIDNSPHKDLSSIPMSKFEFPNIVYMIVDKKIELETKYLREYPEWQFLSKDELNRKTIQIYIDMKNAKRFCNKEQKVIKVPNTEVFKIVAPLLLSRGISRIVSDDKLISL